MSSSTIDSKKLPNAIYYATIRLTKEHTVAKDGVQQFPFI